MCYWLLNSCFQRWVLLPIELTLLMSILPVHAYPNIYVNMQNRGSHHGFYWVFMIMHTLARQINSLTQITTDNMCNSIINMPPCIKTDIICFFMQIRGSHLGCERLVMVISCKFLPRTLLLLLKLMKLPPWSGMYHLFTLQI